MIALSDWLSIVNNVLEQPFSKLATIWYDSIALQVPIPDLVEKYITALREKGTLSSEASRHLAGVWRPLQDSLPDYRFLANDPFQNEDLDTVHRMGDVIRSQLRGVDGDIAETYEELREVAWTTAGYLHVLDTWARLNKDDQCCLLADADGEEVLRTAIPRLPSEGEFNTFRRVVAIDVPDLDALSWDHVLELRHHPYFENFRTVLRSLHGNVANIGEQELHSYISEMKLSEMERIVKAERPYIGRAMLKAFVGNLPIPLLNPFSMASSAMDLLHQHQRAATSGWLYFMLDLKDTGAHVGSRGGPTGSCA